jgi:predicted nucleotide-binding protein
MDKETATAKLQACLDALRSLSAELADDPSFQKWRRDTEIDLEHIFGAKSRHANEFRNIGFRPRFTRMFPSPSEDARVFIRGSQAADALLRSMIDEINEYGFDSKNNTPSISTAKSKRVFIVHGHNEAYRESVARLIKKLDLEPIILHEQPNQGRTIIEKFEKHSDVGFAVIILSADDLGGKAGASGTALQPRARQNVIMELGFFLGRLNRSRVCALYQEGVEIPSDYNGVAFVALDAAGAWQTKLAGELKAAGFAVDLNKLA